MAAKKDTKGRVLKENEDQLSDGRYRYRYTDARGNRHSIYSWKLTSLDKIPAGKRDDLSLREKKRNIERDLEDGILTSSATMTVTELVKKYLTTKARLATATRNNYEHMLRKNIQPNRLGEMSISSVKKSDIKTFYAYLYGKKHFALKSIQLYQNLLFPAFQLAVDDNIIRVNPCRNCMKEYVRGSLSSEKNPLTIVEQRVLLNFVRDDTYYADRFPIIAFMIGSGCRIGEAIGLTWDDIDFSNKCVRITHQLIYKKIDGKIRFYASLPKNGQERTIPLQASILDILSSHKTRTYFMSRASGFEVDGYKHFVFINREARVPTPNTIVRAFHSIRDAYNKSATEDAIENGTTPLLLPDFTPHTLRHTFCTRMAEAGIDIKVLQTLMGHQNIAVTMQVYNHVDTTRMQRAVSETADVLAV